jgi:hypothetical protein
VAVLEALCSYVTKFRTSVYSVLKRQVRRDWDCTIGCLFAPRSLSGSRSRNNLYLLQAYNATNAQGTPRCIRDFPLRSR